jgi:hypothetical protein
MSSQNKCIIFKLLLSKSVGRFSYLSTLSALSSAASPKYLLKSFTVTAFTLYPKSHFRKILYAS